MISHIEGYESAILPIFSRVTQSKNSSIDYQVLTSLLPKSDEVRRFYPHILLNHLKHKKYCLALTAFHQAFL